MTTGERLRALAGQDGAAATLLTLIGAGATTGAALVNYSGLLTGSAAEHLLAERAAPWPGGTFGLGFEQRPQPKRRARRKREDELIWL